MSFQAYLDTIAAKTGMGPADFRVIAQDKGLLEPGVKTGALVEWLAADYGLGRGHAMAIVATLKPTRAADVNADDPIGAHFAGGKAHWRSDFDSLVEHLREHGPVAITPSTSYLSLVKGTAKFAVVAVTANRLDIGIKLKGDEPTERFEAAGSWNSMVTHRVRIASSDQIDDDVLEWLRRAYDRA